MEQIIYDLITLNKDKVIKLQPHPSEGAGPLICDIECNLDIKYSSTLVSPDNINCYISPQERYMRVEISGVDNYILYQGANSAVSASYIKTTDNIISDKYTLKYIYFFFNVGNYIDNKTDINSIEVRLVHESVNSNPSDSKIYIANVLHINNKGGDTSVQSKLYESLFNNILEYKTSNPNTSAYSQKLSTLCSKGSDCIASVNSNNFTIDNKIDSGFYSYLDINVGYKLYWIIFQKEVSITNTTFTKIKEYMNAKTDTPQYITPQNEQDVYINIDGKKYVTKHFLYIYPNGTEIPTYAQNNYGIRADTETDTSGQQTSGQNNTDNLIVLNTPNNNEKIVIEVDKKIESFKSFISNSMSNIKEHFSTINIKKNNDINTNTEKAVQIRNIIIICLIIIIFIYFIISKTNIYNKIYNNLFQLLLFLKIKLFSLFSSKKYSHGGDINAELSDIKSNSTRIDPPFDKTELSAQIELDNTIPKKEPITKNQQGGYKKKYKLGLKKMKRKLI